VLIRVAAATLVVWAALAGGPTRADQDWRALAEASFDDAWQTVNDSYFDPAFGGVNWRQVRADLRPKITAAGTPDEARNVIRDMLGRLGQSHFTLLAPDAADARPAGPASIPIDVRLIRNDVVITAVAKDSQAWQVGLRPGESILNIDGMSMSSVVGKPTSRAEQLHAWRRVVASLHGGAGVGARITLRTPFESNIFQGATSATVDVARGQEQGQEVTVGNLPPMLVRTNVSEARTPSKRVVGVIGFNVWMTAVAAPFATAIDKYRQADGLIIDLRGNPGGLAEMIRGIAGHVLREPALLGRVKTRNADLEFRANPRRSTDDGRRVEPFAGPVAILVDELTGSASECFAGGLQSLGRARVFGETTMGQALPAVTRQLPNGDVMLYAIGDFVTSTGQRLEGRGVVPDEVVPLSVAALWEGRDGALDAALVWLDRQQSTRSR
jgi:carboxyl-terminal processing protease